MRQRLRSKYSTYGLFFNPLSIYMYYKFSSISFMSLTFEKKKKKGRRDDDEENQTE